MDGRLVAIDTMVLVWGIRKEGGEEQKKRAKWLFDRLHDEKAQILVPSVAVCEYVTPVEPEKRNEVIAALSSRFIIPPFDVRCAALAAQLFKDGKSTRKMDSPGARKCLRSDAFIITTAPVRAAGQVSGFRPT